mmetsp:Transcript_57811/g.183310  ORF Transcript_57811/g.183310 Transcript_57811/m.183310 type:complete len:207 (+) Transcript_57811:1232-1852(+)
MSCTSNSRTLKVGESIAHCRAQPRDTDSDALRVRPPSLPNTEVMVVSTAGTREAEPTSSTEWMSSLERPESSRALARGFSTRSSTGLASSRNWSRSIWKETSLSSIRDSTLRGAEVLALRIFLSLSQAVRRRRDALWLLRTSILYFSLHASAKWSNSASSKSRPPTFSSHAWARTRSSPFLKATTTTCRGPSTGARESQLPEGGNG